MILASYCIKWYNNNNIYRSGKSTDGQVAVSLLLHCIQSETYALVLGRDGHLRVWSCSKSACVRSIDVLGDTADSQSQLTQGCKF